MDRTVRILERREVFHRFIFRIDEVKLQHELFDGSMSAPITRLVLHRGDSVAILLHDRENRLVFLCEQFRAPTCDHGPGWLLELAAGVLETGEDEEECARRETLEETGYSARSPPGSPAYHESGSRNGFTFMQRCRWATRTGKATAWWSEGEDMRLVGMPATGHSPRARAGQILDGRLS